MTRGWPSKEELAKELAAERDDAARELDAAGQRGPGAKLAQDQLKVAHADQLAAYGHQDLAGELRREVGD